MDNFKEAIKKWLKKIGKTENSWQINAMSTREQLMNGSLKEEI